MSSYPTDLPERPQQQTWHSRTCPNMRTCWSFSLSSYSLATSDKAVLARRICMITILGVRTAISVLSIMFRAYGHGITSFVVGAILAVLGFFFIAWCLGMRYGLGATWLLMWLLIFVVAWIATWQPEPELAV